MFGELADPALLAEAGPAIREAAKIARGALEGGLSPRLYPGRSPASIPGNISAFTDERGDAPLLLSDTRLLDVVASPVLKSPPP